MAEVCTQLREQYLRYPGISRAALAIVPTNLETLRVSEGLLGIVLSGGVAPQAAAWAVDALLLYVNASCLEAPHGTGNGALIERFAQLPETFPNTKRHAAELTAGTPLDRFTFTLNLMLTGLDTPG